MPEDSDDGVWRLNYFNYFTEVEEQFQRARATGLFLLSPLDWALIESWKNAGIPMEAVLRGIQVAFDQWRAKKHKTQMVNSLTYCAQAVMKEAELMAKNRHRRPRWTRNRRSLETCRRTWKSRDAPLRAALRGECGGRGGLARQPGGAVHKSGGWTRSPLAMEDKMAAGADAAVGRGLFGCGASWTHSCVRIAAR